MQDIFDRKEYCSLTCRKCGRIIYNGQWGMFWPETSPYNNAQIMAIVSHKVLFHECLIKYTTENIPPFKIGSVVINTMSGHTWKLIEQEEVDIIVQGFANGKTNIQLYI